MEIPYYLLSDETLNSVVEAFVLREGTDYGEIEYSLDAKVSSILKQLKNGSAIIVFDDDSGTCDIIPKSTPLRERG